MGRLFCSWERLIICSVAVSLTSISFSQTVTQNPPGSISAATLPLILTECEGTDSCSTWTFLGVQENGHWRIRGNVTWKTGEVAALTFESVHDMKAGGIAIKIRRKDDSGPSAGLTATYEATLRNGRLEGEFASSGPRNGENKSGKWYATLKDDALSHPKAMRMTVSGTPFYWSFTANNKGSYDAALSNASAHDAPVSTATMTLQQFAPDAVAMRIEGGGHVTTVTGKMYREISRETSIVSGEWSSDLGQNGRFILTWADSLTEIPTAQDMVLLGRPKVMYLIPTSTPLVWTFTAQDNGIYEAVLNNTTLKSELARGLMWLDSFRADSVTLRIQAAGHSAGGGGKMLGQKNTAIGVWTNDLGQNGRAAITWDEGLAAVPITGSRHQASANSANEDALRYYFALFGELLREDSVR